MENQLAEMREKERILKEYKKKITKLEEIARGKIKEYRIEVETVQSKLEKEKKEIKCWTDKWEETKAELKQKAGKMVEQTRK